MSHYTPATPAFHSESSPWCHQPRALPPAIPLPASAKLTHIFCGFQFTHNLIPKSDKVTLLNRPHPPLYSMAFVWLFGRCLWAPINHKLVKAGTVSAWFSAESLGLSTAPGKWNALRECLLEEHGLECARLSPLLCPCGSPGIWLFVVASHRLLAYLLLCLQSILYAEGPTD